MRNMIKTFVLAAALTTGGASLAMAQAVPIDGTEAAPDSIHNPNARVEYGVPAGYSGYTGNNVDDGGYRTRVMLGAYGSPYTANSPWTFEQGRDQSDLGEF